MASRTEQLEPPKSHLSDMFSSTVSDTRDINDTKKTTHKQRKLINKKLCSNNEQKVSEKNTVRVDYQKVVSCIASGSQLGDEHINAANLLLRSQFPDLQGLYMHTSARPTTSFPEFNAVQDYAGFDYFQVLHTGSDHWVTVQILSQEEARVYDSVFLKPTFHTLKQIASIVKSMYNQMQVI